MSALSTTTTSFALPAKREKIETIERANALLQPLASASTADITHVSLSGMSFDPIAAAAFADRISQLTSLTNADFSDIIAGQKTEEALVSLATLSNALSAVPLLHFNVSDNAVGIRGVSSLKPALNKPLQSVRINNAGLQGDAVANIVQSITAERPSTTLRAIEFRRNLLGGDGANALATLVDASPQLQHISVASSRISGGLALCTSIGKLQRLEHLNLSDNSLGTPAGLMLAKRLLTRVNSSRLVHLDLADIGVDKSGMKAILRALTRTDVCPQLVHLDVQQNELTWTTGKLLGEVVRTRAATLTTLIMDDNELRATGAISILTAVRDHSTALTTVSLNNNMISSRISDVATQLRSHATVQRVALNGNRFNEETLETLRSDFFGDLDENEDEMESEDEQDTEDEADQVIQEAERAENAGGEQEDNDKATQDEVDSLANELAQSVHISANK